MHSTSATTPPAPQSLALRFGPFVLDQRGGRLLRDGQPLNLAPRPWALLCFLAQRPGHLVTKDELLDAVWGHRFVSESALKVTVNTLRQALGEEAREAHWVQTVPRRGYRFHAEVEVLADPAPPRTMPVAPAAPVTPRTPAQLGNLPLPVGPLIGREQDLAELADALVTHPLITLVGPGGVGKTRLALAAAAQAGPPGGVWLVRLDDLDRADALSRAVVRAVGLGDGAGESPQALAQALAPLHLTLLLDNAEHLADALAPQLALWLQHAPQLSVLVTSQRPLQLAQERVWPVAPLALPEPAADAAALRASPAVALMLQRVQTLQPGWQSGPDDLVDLVAIACALDGLPLALELAAARVPLLGAAGVRQRLGARLQMLTGGPAHAPMRQRTLRASLEWSVGLLPPLPTRALHRLAVFAGGFTAEAAQAVLAPALPGADEWVVLDTLTLLRDMALLAAPAASTPSARLVAQVPRLRLLDSVRLFGLERLAGANDLESAQADHRAWVLALFLAAEEAYLVMGVERWLAPLEGETDNLMASMDRGLAALEAAPPINWDARPDATFDALATELASLLAAATNFCLRTGLGQVNLRWRERLRGWMDARPFELPSAVRARWCLAGAMLGGQGLLSTRNALVLAEQAITQLTDAPARRQLALYVAGMFQLRLGQRDALATTLECMRTLPGEADATVYVRKLRPMLEALVSQKSGDDAAYLAFWVESLAESRALGDRVEAWRAAWGVGQAYFLQGDVDGAVAVMDQAIHEVRAAGRLHTQTGFAGQAVFVRLARDSSPETLARLLEMVPILQSQGLLFSALGDVLAWVPLRQGRLADALRVQAWADARAATENTVRSHVAQRVRDAFASQTAHAAAGDAPPLNEEGALRLVLLHPANTARSDL